MAEFATSGLTAECYTKYLALFYVLGAEIHQLGHTAHADPRSRGTLQLLANNQHKVMCTCTFQRRGT